jgi:hypothetical protein
MGGTGSGGPNGGPQYNPANVNGLGGNGQSGDYTGFAYGENKALNDSRVAGNAAISSIGNARTPAVETQPLTAINAGTQLPGQHIMDGAPIGPGANSIPGLPQNASGDPDIDLIRDQYPMMQAWASMPGTTRATADLINYFGTVI